MLTAPPLDCWGAEAGAWTPLELLLLDEEPASPPEEFELPGEPVPTLDPVPDVPVPAEVRVTPGSMSATTPAAAKLATPTLAVVTFSR